MTEQKGLNTNDKKLEKELTGPSINLFYVDIISNGKTYTFNFVRDVDRNNFYLHANTVYKSEKRPMIVKDLKTRTDYTFDQSFSMVMGVRKSDLLNDKEYDLYKFSSESEFELQLSSPASR